MTLSRRIARPLLGSLFIVGGANSLRNSRDLAAEADPVPQKVAALLKKVAPSAPIPEDPKQLVRINGAIHLIGGLAVATGRFPRPAALLLAATLVPTTIAGHDFWAQTDPTEKQHQRFHFLQNTSLIGGLLIAAGDTEGKPGLAWRAGRAAKDAKREAGQLAKTAKREAKLAKAKVS